MNLNISVKVRVDTNVEGLMDERTVKRVEIIKDKVRIDENLQTR